MCVSVQSCLALCDHMDCSLPGSSVHGIFQARKPEWIATPGNLPDQGIRRMSIASIVLAGRFFSTALPGKPTT